MDCGEIKCATMPSETSLVTGGTSTVVCVWDVPAPRDRNKTLHLVQVTNRLVNVYPSLSALTFP